MSDTRKDKDKKTDHMKRRKEHGLSYREMEKDFGVSKSKIHRDIRENSEDD